MDQQTQLYDLDADAHVPREHRMVSRLYRYWQRARGSRPYPALTDMSPDSLPGSWPHRFVLHAMDGNELRIADVGPSVIGDCAVDIVGRSVSDVPDDCLLGVGLSHCRQVLDSGAPLSWGGRYLSRRKTTICYRSIVLPLSGNGRTIDALFGAANGKQVAPDADG